MINKSQNVELGSIGLESSGPHNSVLSHDHVPLSSLPLPSIPEARESAAVQSCLEAEEAER